MTEEQTELTHVQITRLRTRADTYEKRIEVMVPGAGAKMVVFDKRYPREVVKQIRQWCDRLEQRLDDQGVPP